MTLVLVWVLLAVNVALLIVNARALRQNRQTLDRLMTLYLREAERGYQDGLRVVTSPMSDGELRRRGL